MLLGVTRAQCSMFVSGKRDLPLAAKNKLITLLQHFQNEKGVSEERLQLDKAEAEKTQEQLQQHYLTVQIRLYQVAKKINIIEKIRSECLLHYKQLLFSKIKRKSTLEQVSRFVQPTH